MHRSISGKLVNVMSQRFRLKLITPLFSRVEPSSPAGSIYAISTIFKSLKIKYIELFLHPNFNKCGYPASP